MRGLRTGCATDPAHGRRFRPFLQIARSDQRIADGANRCRTGDRVCAGDQCRRRKHGHVTGDVPDRCFLGNHLLIGDLVGVGFPEQALDALGGIDHRRPGAGDVACQPIGIAQDFAQRVAQAFLADLQRPVVEGTLVVLRSLAGAGCFPLRSCPELKLFVFVHDHRP